MKLEKLKELCDGAIGLKGTICDTEEVLNPDTPEEHTVHSKVVRYMLPSGGTLLDVYVDENAGIGWYFGGKVRVDAEGISNAVQHRYRSARLSEVEQIRKSRGAGGAAHAAADKVQRMEGALRIAHAWMERMQAENRVDETFYKDAYFVQQVLNETPPTAPVVKIGVRDSA